MSTKEELEEIRERLAALEAKAGQPLPADPDADPGLGIFVRPLASAPKHGLGSRMGGPDLLEAVRRACHGVNYRGNVVLDGAALDEAWAEIEGLKVGDPELRRKYRLLWPSYAGFALLTGDLTPAKYDGFDGAAKRDAKAGKTIRSFLEQEFAVMAGGAAPSGGEAGE